MHIDGPTSTEPSEEASAPAESDLRTQWQRSVRRRSFLRGLGLASASLPIGVLASTTVASADDGGSGSLNRGDAAILRFLAAAEIIETDLWQQYAELGGVDGGNPAYMAALENLDEDMPQYISDNTDDEETHAEFLNAYLRSKGAQPVNLDRFRTLPSSKATGAKKARRLTMLQNLTVDTSWYLRYRGTQNPDLGGTFGQALTIKNQPAIPVSDADTPPGQSQPVPPVTPQQRRMQAIANTAGFHFAFIEQGGSSLYTTMAQKASSLEVLRIVVSIGGVEVNHFAIWHDKVGNCVAQPLAGVVDPVTGLTFPDFNSPPFGGERFQTNLIMPEPCDFISRSLPRCSVIRPSSTRLSGAVAAVRAFTADGLFQGQSREFFATIMGLAVAADAASRQVS
jgi:hypothetical protein